jgi:hypothetical protein
VKKKLVILGIVAILVSVGLSGCNQVSNRLNPDRDKFLGTWKVVEFNNSTTSGEVYTFFSDGTVGITNTMGTWEFKDGKLVLDFDVHQYVYSYNFSDSDRTLTWISMDKITSYKLTKQAEIN